MNNLFKMKDTCFIKRHSKWENYSWGMFLFCIGAFSYPLHSYSVESQTFSVMQQDQKLHGKITDSKGEPIIGANVIVKGSTNGTITDFDGMFNLSVPANAVIVIKYIGYKQQEISVKGRSTINVVLKEDNEILDEVVVVGYGTKQKKSLTASVETVSTKEMQSMPVGNASNAFAGRVPGLITVQNNGEIGADGTNIMIRGVGTTGNSNPLIVVDGVPRGSLNEIDINNVKSYTVLKDAAAVAPYGIGGANGVILIETKSGTEGKPVVNYNGWIGWSSPTVDIEYMNSYQYASTYDKAQEMAGVPASQRLYSAEDLEMYRRSVNGDPSVDQNLYPNANAHDFLLRKSAPVTNHNVSISGGTEYVKYYVGINTLYQEEQWHGSHLNRTGVVSKIDIKATNTTKFGLSINGWTQRTKKKQNGGTAFYRATQDWIPTDPIQYVTKDGEILDNASSKALVLSDLKRLGDYVTDKNMIMLSGYIEQQLAKGLTFKGVISYDWTLHNNKNWSEPASTYYKIDTSTNPYSFREVTNKNLPSLQEGMNQIKTYTYQGILTYKGKFGDHSLNLLGVGEAIQTKYNDFWASRSNYQIPIPELNLGSSDKEYQANGGGSYEAAQVGFVAQIGYDYKGKYLLDLTGRYDGHYYFAPGSRWGFFPAVAVGWRVSEEQFMQRFENLDNLKLRFSAGQSGALAGGAFQYLTSFQLYGDSFAEGGSSTQGVKPVIEGNPNITWERATKYNVGIDVDLFGGQLSGKVDYFFEKRDNMLVSPQATVPEEYGIGLAAVNNGRMQNQGIEFEIHGHKSIKKDLLLSAGFNFTFARNKLLEIYENEATRNNPNRSRTGRPLGSIFGYEADGLFQVSDDKNGDGVIDSKDGFVEQQLGGPVTPGSIKYKNLYDVDGTAVIDLNDETCIGHPTIPEIMYGFNLGATWKGINLDLLFQGAAHSNALIGGTFINPFGETHNLTIDNLDFWTPENPDAKYPIVRPNGPVGNDVASSSFYMLNMNYLRLKQLELGYTLPSAWLSRCHIKSAKVYVAATNLFTLSHTRGLLDPEQDGGSTTGDNANRGWRQPQNKTISLGMNITF